MTMAITAPQNPYIAGNSVGGSSAFVGRDDVLREVYRVLRHPQQFGIVLYGQRRIGKTSILEHLMESLPAQGPFQPVYFDLQDKAKWPLGEVLEDLARGIAEALHLAAPVPEADVASWFRAKWLPSVLGNLPAGASLVILFDEFDVLADARSEQAAAAFFPYLRQLLADTGGRLRFAFVIGRNIDDLANIVQGLFKNLASQRVSLLSEVDAKTLIRMSEANGSLTWTSEASAAAWDLTHGHPFLLQHLCSQVWERAHDNPGVAAGVKPADVDAAVPSTLDTSRNALEWLWAGLPPAARVVASALAEAGPQSISQDALDQLLHESGIRVVIRHLREAPHLLQDWDLIEPVNSGYQFRVELLRQWIARFRPLSRVQKELDYVEPIAESLYRTAELHYHARNLDSALAPLREALGINPNHIRASELLADILISRREWKEARQLLEQLHENNPPVARARLVQVLMAQADAAGEEDERLGLLDYVLRLQKHHPAAESARQQIWKGRGDRAREAGRLEDAIDAYRTAGDAESEARVERELRERDVAAAMDRVKALQLQDAHAAAYEELRKVAAKFPDLRDWKPDLDQLQPAAYLETTNARAMLATRAGHPNVALSALVDIIGRDPTYKNVTARLHELVTGRSVEELERALADERSARTQAAEAHAAEITEARRGKLVAEELAEKARHERDRVAAELRRARQQSEENARRERDRVAPELRELDRVAAELRQARQQNEEVTARLAEANRTVVGATKRADMEDKAARDLLARVAQRDKQLRNWRRGAIGVCSVGILAAGGLFATSTHVETLWLDHKVARAYWQVMQSGWAERLNTELRRRLVEEGSLHVQSVVITADVRPLFGDGKCFKHNEGPSSFPEDRTCYVNVNVTLRNNAYGVLAPTGALCVKYINPDGSTVTGIPSYSPPPQNGPCSLGVPLNIPGSEKQPTVKVDVGEALIKLGAGWGSDTGKYFIGKVGRHRVEFWWLGNKIGETSFQIEKPDNPF